MALKLTKRADLIIRLAWAENDFEMAEQAQYDHDGSELDAPERMKKAQQEIARLKQLLTELPDELDR